MKNIVKVRADVSLKKEIIIQALDNGWTVKKVSDKRYVLKRVAHSHVSPRSKDDNFLLD